ncbi:hypothetical protein PIB30_097608 [Stylosanthes scabra]|uniref:Aminotransferase-like plant mobile domain-containing protein n=1 Tax=Stylosanthes scabra TaxID=79078 RepID=A0ABU6SYS5_9FABA|nr:hypothetical protein [Stylosanthes scabra]
MLSVRIHGTPPWILLTKRCKFRGRVLVISFTSGGSLSSIASMTTGDTDGNMQFLPGCTGVCAEPLTGTLAGPLHLLQSWILWRFLTLRSYEFDDFVFSLASRWGRYLPTSNEKGPRVIQHKRQLDRATFCEFIFLPYRVDAVEAVVHPSILHPDQRALLTLIVPLIYFGSIEWHQVDRVIPQFGGVQNAPHRLLNIDFLHSRDGRGIDRWWPQHYQIWHGVWATQFAQVFEVTQSDDLDPQQTSCDGGTSWEEVPSSGRRIPSVAIGRDTGRGHIDTDPSTPKAVSGRRCSEQQATSEEDDG